MITFSIITPAYNCQNTVEKCIRSVIQQSYENYEMIVINDGSTDNTVEIVKNVIIDVPKIQLYNQENKGASMARNYGLSLAKGDYIVFLDSDDYLEPDFLSVLNNAIQNHKTDIYFYGFNMVDDSGQIIKRKIPKIVSNDFDDTIISLKTNDMFGYTWIKAFKREVIQGVLFDSTMTLFEDELFVLNALGHCNSIQVLPVPIYNYRSNSIGLMSKTYQEYPALKDKIYCRWHQYLDNKCDMFLLQIANSSLASCYYYYLERQIDTKDFICMLKQTRFFKDASESDFKEYVSKKRIRTLELLRFKYRMKNRIRKLVRRHS